LQTLVTDATFSISSLSRITVTALQFSYYIAIFEIIVPVRLGFRSCQVNKRRYEFGCSSLCQPSSLRMADFPYRRCHRCSVTDNQLHYPRVIHIAAHKLLLQLFVFVSVFFLLVNWLCHRDVCRLNKNKGSNKCERKKPSKGR
jgi:hypothetical protein